MPVERPFEEARRTHRLCGDHKVGERAGLEERGGAQIPTDHGRRSPEIRINELELSHGRPRPLANESVGQGVEQSVGTPVMDVGICPIHVAERLDEPVAYRFEEKEVVPSG